MRVYLEPFPEDRYSNASTALDHLHGSDKIYNFRPRNALAQISQEGETMTVMIPAILLTTKNSKKTFFVIIALFLALFLYLILKLETGEVGISLFTLVAFLVNFQTFFLIYPLYSTYQYYFSIMYQHEIVIDEFSLIHATIRAGKRVVRTNIPLSAINHIGSAPAGLFWMSHCVQIRHSKDEETSGYCFGRHLDAPEQRWIAHQLKQHQARYPNQRYPNLMVY